VSAAEVRGNHEHGHNGEEQLIEAARQALAGGDDAIAPLESLLHHYVCSAPHWAKAARVASRLIEEQQKLHGPDSPQSLAALGELATALSITGDNTSSELACRLALRIAERAFGAASPDARRARYRLFDHLLLTGHAEEAEEVLRPLGEPPTGPFEAWARLYERTGRLTDWEHVVQAWLASAEATRDQDEDQQRNLRITLLAQLARAQAGQEKWALAESSVRQALEILDQLDAQRTRVRFAAQGSLASAARESIGALRRIELLTQHAEALRSLHQWQRSDDRFVAALKGLDRSADSVIRLPGQSEKYERQRQIVRDEAKARILRGRAVVLRELGDETAAREARSEAVRLQDGVDAYRADVVRNTAERLRRMEDETGPDL
jgi:tetratricopeptide (TPR) repeat protein